MKTRIVSAVIAVLLVTIVFVVWRTTGIYVIASLVSLGGLREFTRLVYKPEETLPHIRIAFVFLTAAVFAATQFNEKLALFALNGSAVIFLTLVLLTIQTKEDLGRALHVQSMGLLGFFYCGLMPGLTTRLLQMDQGYLWMFGLLGIVFSGDTMAYLVGRTFGKVRLLEAVSPKKSIEGALGGLIGSALAGLVLSLFIPGQSPLLLFGAALVTGVFAQIGDLFESLLKRVADVKDSGTMMPGHGGILDRLDGVYFASPVYFLLVRFLTGH
jgi:phosphatidate cytidylyltransferase